MEKITHLVITKFGETVCEYSSFEEAARCKHDLIATDKQDGTYEKGFYKIKRCS